MPVSPPRIFIPQTLTCTPAELGPEVSCLVCAGSKQELLASFDGLLCQSLRLESCSPSTLLSLSKPYMQLSESELAGAATYLWLVFLQTEDPESDIEYQAIAKDSSLFMSRPTVELLAMQLWLLCRMEFPIPGCNASDLLSYGHCLCVSYRELLAIRVYLLIQFIGNFAQFEVDPNILRQYVQENAPGVSTSTFEAVIAWLMCQLYNLAVENPT